MQTHNEILGIPIFSTKLERNILDVSVSSYDKQIQEVDQLKLINLISQSDVGYQGDEMFPKHARARLDKIP